MQVGVSGNSSNVPMDWILHKGLLNYEIHYARLPSQLRETGLRKINLRLRKSACLLGATQGTGHSRK